MRKLKEALIKEQRNKISGGIYNKLQVDFAYNSNHIEGSRLTHEQTRYIYETRTISGEGAKVNDVIETANHFKCFSNILNTLDEQLTEDYIKSLHAMLKNGIMEDDDVIIGDYKKVPNFVGEIETAAPQDVADKIKALLNKYAGKLTLYDIAAFHAEFEKIHPFYDGNGRVGRLIMLKQCLENDIVPFIVDENRKMFYYKGLAEWQTEGKRERLIDTFLSLQDYMKAVLDYFQIDYDRTDMKCRDVIKQGENAKKS